MSEAVNLNFWRALRRALTVTYRQTLRNPLRENWVTACVVAAIALAYALDAGSWLAYRRAAVEEGEWWRLATPLFVHGSPDHLGWNLLTMASAGVVAERIGRLRYFLTLVASALSVGLVAHFAIPAVGAFIGASGTAAAVFAFILVRLGAINFRVDPWVTLVSTGILLVWATYEAGFWGATTPWEVLTGRSVRGTPGHIVVSYHLIGMLTAVPVALWPGVGFRLRERIPGRH
jgi:membrane associated rhomboid family serine protease